MEEQKTYVYFLVGKKKVDILQSFDHSYLVRYVKSGKEVSIAKEFVKKVTKRYIKKIHPKNTQFKLDL